jgi:recombination protein RecR
LNSNKNFIESFANSLLNLQKNIKRCEICGILIDSNKEICNICGDINRNKNEICVVEEYLDMVSIESS